MAINYTSYTFRLLFVLHKYKGCSVFNPALASLYLCLSGGERACDVKAALFIYPIVVKG